MTDEQDYIESLEKSLIDHEAAIDRINQKLATLYETERQANMKLFMERIGFTINAGDVLNVTEEFKDYAREHLTAQNRSNHLELWNQRKEGELIVFNYHLENGLPVVDVEWIEVKYRRAIQVLLYNIPFRSTPIAIIKAMARKRLRRNFSTRL